MRTKSNLETQIILISSFWVQEESCAVWEHANSTRTEWNLPFWSRNPNIDFCSAKKIFPKLHHSSIVKTNCAIWPAKKVLTFFSESMYEFISVIVPLMQYWWQYRRYQTLNFIQYKDLCIYFKMFIRISHFNLLLHNRNLMWSHIKLRTCEGTMYLSGQIYKYVNDVFLNNLGYFQDLSSPLRYFPATNSLSTTPRVQWAFNRAPAKCNQPIITKQGSV